MKTMQDQFEYCFSGASGNSGTQTELSLQADDHTLVLSQTAEWSK